jgi:mycothiol synthase
VHPACRSQELEREVLEVGETRLARPDQKGRRRIVLPAFVDDLDRQEALLSRGYFKGQNTANHWRRDLIGTIPVAPPPPGYTVRSMGDASEHPARSLASWRSFHSDEGDEAYDGDFSWFANLQNAPLYRRDLDLVAIAKDSQIAAFCTIYYDDCTRSAVSVLVGTAAEHWHKGLGKALMYEGMRRAQGLGCTRFFASAYDPPADALYASVLQQKQVSETWIKELSEGSVNKQ